MNITVAVLEAVADEKDTDPQNLDFSLTEHIDPDAITQLAAHPTASWTLSFELPDHTVTVTSDGLILVDGARKEVWKDL